MKNKQKTLQEQNKLIAQRNQLVEGRHNYSLWELRLFIEMMQKIERNDEGFKPVKIYFKDLVKQYGSKSNDDYRKIANAAVKLMRKMVKIEYTTDEGEERFLHSPLVQGVTTPKRMDDGFDKYIELWFADKLKPLLLDLKKNYLLYDKRNILNLKSKFSIRIYQLLKRHERKDKQTAMLEYEVAELRNMLLVDDEGNPTNQYTRYSQFEQRVLRIAEKELKEHTDIAFSFDKIKQGRKVHSIRFYICKNRTEKTTEPKTKQMKVQPTAAAPDFADPIHNNKAYQMLIDKKISQDQAFNLVKNYDTQFILETIQRCSKEHKDYPKKNLAGFIIDSITKERYKTDIKTEQETQEKKKKQAQKKKKRELEHKLIQEYYEQFEQQKKQKVEQIKNGLSKEETAEIITAIREKYHFAANRNDSDLIDNVYFDLMIVERYQDTQQLQKIDYDFYYWMEQVHKVKVQKNDDMFELIS